MKSFGITVDNSRNAILNKSEELIINKSENNNEKSKNLFKSFNMNNDKFKNYQKTKFLFWKAIQFSILEKIVTILKLE